MDLLSKRAFYAIKALVVLALAAPEQVTIPEMAQAAHIPERFLGNIILQLRNAEIVASSLGRYGGYSLKIAPDEISIATIIRICDGPYEIHHSQEFKDDVATSPQGNALFQLYDLLNKARLSLNETLDKSVSDLLKQD